MSPSVRSPKNRSTKSHGFTLLELLVVMFIIALVIAIVLPALGHVKIVTKITSTTAMMRDMSTATSQFELDNNRSPGYFSAREMGASSNANLGFTMMENAMLELAGGVVQGGSGPNVIRVGPSGNIRNLVEVDLDLIGADRVGAATYWMPDPRFYVAQDGDEGGVQMGSAVHGRLPDVVDAFGAPVLLWIEDDTAIGSVTSVNDFALIESGADPAHFYWNSNAGFLDSEALGKSHKNQTDPTTGSRIGSGTSEENRIESLAGILGHPAYPTPSDLSGGLSDTYPGAARGKIVIHSAGPDGYYFGRADKRGQGNAAGAIAYGLNFFNVSGDRHLDNKDIPMTDDVISGYDDIVETAGN